MEYTISDLIHDLAKMSEVDGSEEIKSLLALPDLAKIKLSKEVPEMLKSGIISRKQVWTEPEYLDGFKKKYFGNIETELDMYGNEAKISVLSDESYKNSVSNVKNKLKVLVSKQAELEKKLATAVSSGKESKAVDDMIASYNKQIEELTTARTQIEETYKSQLVDQKKQYEEKALTRSMLAWLKGKEDQLLIPASSAIHIVAPEFKRMLEAKKGIVSEVGDNEYKLFYNDPENLSVPLRDKSTNKELTMENLLLEVTLPLTKKVPDHKQESPADSFKKSGIPHEMTQGQKTVHEMTVGRL